MRRENMDLTDMISAPWQIANLPKNTPVLLALSGGADSRFLLHVLAQMAKRDGFSLAAAHVDHGIRGEESTRDAAFCESLAKSYGIEFFMHREDVLRLAKERGTGIEETAREVRYSYFAALMKEKNLPLLVTAHNADDNAETVLFRLARGTGLSGLCAISPVRAFEGGYLVRPMLKLSKREILSYCASEQLAYVTDRTNTDVSYSRNRIRAEVLPVLEGLFDGATERISEMTSLLREDEEVLRSITDRFLETHCQSGTCPLTSLLEQPVAIRRRVLSSFVYQLIGAHVERAHVDAVLRLAQNAVPHSSVTLPGGASVAIEHGALCPRESLEAVTYRVPLQEGETLLPDGKLLAVVGDGAEILKVHNLSTAPYIILKNLSDIMKNELYWRPRREGDKILLRGMHRSVRRLYREAGFSLALRATLPLLCDATGIVWIPFVGTRDGVSLTQNVQEGTLIALLDIPAPTDG